MRLIISARTTVGTGDVEEGGKQGEVGSGFKKRAKLRYVNIFAPQDDCKLCVRHTCSNENNDCGETLQGCCQVPQDTEG